MSVAVGAGAELGLVTVSGPGDIHELIELGIDFVSEAPRLPADALVTPEQARLIEKLGFALEPLEPPNFDIPDEYHTYQETYRVFDSLQARYPDILMLRTIGRTHWRRVPICAVKISDNVAAEEDEPAVLYTGVIHAREPLGNEIIIHLAKYLCAAYASSPAVRRWVDSLEIWLVPVLNPDGYMYMFESARNSPWWRKNQRDNNSNGRFDPGYDGVDLNRNFDWLWSVGGSTNPSDLTYRGPSPNSEAEVRVLCDLAREQQPVFGITYHSYGEVVIYPWSYLNRTTPDEDVYAATAAGLAEAIGYPYRHSAGMSMSTDWLYGRLGVFDFAIETGTQFIEPAHRILGICHQNFSGDTFLFNRLFYSGVRGHVTDSATGAPLVAEVRVLGRVDTTLGPRLTDSLFGAFHRLLNPGTYSFRFTCPGYDTAIVTGVHVTDDSLTRLEVRLRRNSGIAEHGSAAAGCIRVVPNPFRLSARVIGREMETFRLFDATGRELGRVPGATIGPCLAPGVYYIRERSGHSARIVKTQ